VATRVIIDRGMCMGAGECVHLLPAVFAFDDGNRAVVRSVDLDLFDVEALAEASSWCPNFAITVERDEG